MHKTRTKRKMEKTSQNMTSAPCVVMQSGAQFWQKSALLWL